MKKFLKSHLLRIITFVFWVVIIIVYFRYKHIHHLTNMDITKKLYHFMEKDLLIWAFIYIWVYILRTIIFVPASLLVILSPSLFWFKLAFLYTMIWENTSAALWYFLGNFFGKDLLKSKFLKKLEKTKDKLKAETFETILISRLLFLPFDLVNYFAGFLQINFKLFFLWTFIWTIPWILVLLFAWDSVKNVTNFNIHNITINYKYLIYSGLIFIIPLIFYYFYKKRKGRGEK